MKKLELIPRWKEVLTKAWSIRLILVAGVLSGIEVALPFSPIEMAPGHFALASLVATLAATVARLLAQKDMKDE